MHAAGVWLSVMQSYIYLRVLNEVLAWMGHGAADLWDKCIMIVQGTVQRLSRVALYQRLLQALHG